MYLVLNGGGGGNGPVLNWLMNMANIEGDTYVILI